MMYGKVLEVKTPLGLRCDSYGMCSSSYFLLSSKAYMTMLNCMLRGNQGISCIWFIPRFVILSPNPTQPGYFRLLHGLDMAPVVSEVRIGATC